MSTLDTTWRSLATPTRSTREPEGLDFLAREAAAILRSRLPRTARYLTLADQVITAHPGYESLTDTDLHTQARALLTQGASKSRSPHCIQPLAAIVEVARRSVGLRAHREQIAAALAMIDGAIVEMATGEGKTLAALLAAPIMAADRKGCHIVTANDYLAERDALWTRPCLDRLGMRVGFITGPSDQSHRRDAYRSDITYSTSRELAADFLRDRLSLGQIRSPGAHALRVLVAGPLAVTQPLQRGLHAAIIDEADFVLIDDAVTPLLISLDDPHADDSAIYSAAGVIASSLSENQHYRIDHAHREIRLLPAASERIDALSVGTPLQRKLPRDRDALIRQALTALHLYHLDQHYIVRDDAIVIVDESTGRTMPDRTWRDGMHQAVEAKENLQIRPAKRTVARISFQRFFRMYPRLAGMSGTATESRREFVRIYSSPVVPLPTHHPSKRRIAARTAFATQDQRDHAVAEEAARRSKTGQPVLIGTSTVAESERISALLSERSIAHDVLNAVRHEQEADIVANAGQPARVTVATNMAGRGTDIRLTPESLAQGGLCVISAGCALSARIDRQLFGRCARQGDPGEIVIFSSLEDDLAKRFFPRLSPTLTPFLAKPLGQRFTALAQSRAQRRAESIAYTRRRQVLKSDDWLEDALGFAGTE